MSIKSKSACTDSRGVIKRHPSLRDTVYQTDKIMTGNDNSIGFLFDDDAKVAADCKTALALDKLDFDPVTQASAFNVSMQKGTLPVISGKFTQKQPRAFKVKTPAGILAVCVTDYLVRT